MYFTFDCGQVRSSGMPGLSGGRSSSVGGNRLYWAMKFSIAPARSWRRSGQGSNGESACAGRFGCWDCAAGVEVVEDLQPTTKIISMVAMHQAAQILLSKPERCGGDKDHKPLE